MRLRINPDVVGGMADETGGFLVDVEEHGLTGSGSPKMMAAVGEMTGRGTRHRHSPLIWSDEAWTQLFGRTPEELAGFVSQDGNISTRQKEENAKLLRYLEQRLQWMRVVLAVGWMGEVDGGVLAVVGVVQ